MRANARTRLLDAADLLLRRDGYDQTTMQQIVAEAGTSIGNAYFYFPNKERLLVELLEEAARGIWDEVEAVVQDIAAGPSRIGTIIYWNVLSMLTVRRDLAQLVFLTERRVAGVEIVREISIARWLPHLTASFPERTAADVALAAEAIFGANRAVIMRNLAGRSDVEPARIAREMVRWSLRALGASAAEIDAAIRSGARRSRAQSSLKPLPRR